MNRIRTENGRVTQFLMVIGLVVIVSMMLSGCGASKYFPVSKKKYEAAVADMESAKIEFEKSRMMQEAVEQDNEKLRNENDKVAMDLEMMESEIQRIKEGRESERELLSAREAEVSAREAGMAEEGQILTTKFRKLQQEYQKLKSQNRALKNTVSRYQKELKEVRQAKIEQAGRVPKAKVEQAVKVPKAKVEQAVKVPKAVPPKNPPFPTKPVVVSKPIKGSLALVNINTATANDLVLFLGVTKNTAEKVIANRPYRIRGELVAKKVVPKATFDVIKNRITAAPK